jgi:hypothetical protein
MEILWKNCIFDLCGVKGVHRRMFSVVVTSTPEQHSGWLLEVEGIVNRVFGLEDASKSVSCANG